jgi:predicted ArsR family transcriptional regulator
MVISPRQDEAVDGEQQRQMILELLGAARGGLDAKQLAARLELHPNTIRWHLGLLADSGLVEAMPERRHQRGRPSLVYRLTGEGVGRGRDEYRLLAAMLTDLVAADGNGEARAYATGLRWGRHLRRGEPDASLVDLLDQEGFEATQRGERVEMRRCPFYALAEGSPQVICTLHHGVIDGALAETGADDEVERLDPFVEPGLCVAHIRRRLRPATRRAAQPAR